MMSTAQKMLVLTGPDRKPALERIATEEGLEVVHCATADEALQQMGNGESPLVVVMALGFNKATLCAPVLAALKSSYKQSFGIVLSTTAARCPKLKLGCYTDGARMVTEYMPSVAEVVRFIVAMDRERIKPDNALYRYQRGHTCPSCGMGGFTEHGLANHYKLYHGSEPNVAVQSCPICDATPRQMYPCFDVHINNMHGPPEHREPPTTDFAAFSWVVIRRESEHSGEFLLVSEPAGIAGGAPRYWLPAGRLDRGEGFLDAAMREAKEEAGLDIEVRGVLMFKGQRCGTPRFVFLAVPKAAAGGGNGGVDEEGLLLPVPKQIPDFESVSAMWITPEELLAKLTDEDYRGADPAEFFPKVANGEIEAASLDTEAFRNFDALVKEVGVAGYLHAQSPEYGEREQRMKPAWDALKAAYPAQF
jgi:8-oxo-dGTP pyrophosphatase MutT (NUDIX family)